MPEDRDLCGLRFLGWPAKKTCDRCGKEFVRKQIPDMAFNSRPTWEDWAFSLHAECVRAICLVDDELYGVRLVRYWEDRAPGSCALYVHQANEILANLFPNDHVA